MKAYIFPSVRIPDLHYVLLEDGRFAGAFNEEIPPQVLEDNDVRLLSNEEAREHEGLKEALAKNKAITAPASVIYVYGVVQPGEEKGLFFAMAESGHVLAQEVCKPNRAKWKLGVHNSSSYPPNYDRHYPEGYRVVYVPISEVGTDRGLNQARIKNQMLADMILPTPGSGEAANTDEGADDHE